MTKKELTRAILAHLNEEWATSPFADMSKAQNLDKLREECESCQACPLYKSATRLVFGDGNPETRLVIIGEAPGRDEDIQGIPFVGRAGKLLTQTLEECGMPRSEVYICNILKHRPPNNRNPLPEEIVACTPHLVKQLRIINPAIILTLGNFSTRFMLNTNTGITQLRGKIQKSPSGYNILPTLHPAAILRNMNNLPLFRQDITLAIQTAKGKNI